MCIRDRCEAPAACAVAVDIAVPNAAAPTPAAPTPGEDDGSEWVPPHILKKQKAKEANEQRERKRREAAARLEAAASVFESAIGAPDGVSAASMVVLRRGQVVLARGVGRVAPAPAA